MTEPKSFDINDESFAADPWAYFSALREECPVFHSDNVGWVLTKYDDVRAASRDFENFRSDWGPKAPAPRNVPRVRETDEPGSGFSYGAFPVLPIETDPPTHGVYRSILQPMFTAPAIERDWGDEIRRIARDLVTSFVEAGGGDYVSAVAEPMSGLAIGTVLGIPSEQRSEFQKRALQLARDTGPAVEFLDEAIEGAREGAFHVLRTYEIDGRLLTREEKLGYGLILTHAGWETTAGTLATMALRLAEDPSLRQAMLDDPGLLATAPDEFIRVDPSVAGLWRTAGTDIEVRGCPIERGDKVLLLWGAANRDPDAFDRPDEVVLDRKPNRHLSFGDGVHRCLGAALARAEIAAVLEELLAAPPFTVDQAEPIERVVGSVPVIRKLVLRPA